VSSQETVNVFNTDQANSPVLYANLNIIKDDDTSHYGRIDILAAKTSEAGASLDFTVVGEKRLYSSQSASGFEDGHGVEVGFAGNKIEDGRLGPRSVFSDHRLSSSTSERLAYTVMQADKYSEGGFWLLGERDTTVGLKQKLGQFGLDADALYPVIYYNLAAAAEGEPVVVDSSMVDETIIQLSKLEEAVALLKTSKQTNQALGELIDDVAKSELPAIAANQFIDSRRVSHDAEVLFHELGASSVFGAGMRQFLPTGQGRSGRSWPFMDASASDEDVAFGDEKKLLERRERRAVLDILERESRELEGRFSYLDTIITSVRALLAKEQEMREGGNHD
jgi:hypothetical protein